MLRLELTVDLIGQVIFVNRGVDSIVESMREVRRASLSRCTRGPRGFGPVIRAVAGIPERRMPGPSFHGAVVSRTAVGVTGCVTGETAVCKHSDQARQ